MIIEKKVEIIVNDRVVPHFKKLGYDVKSNQKLIVPIEHLNKGSHAIVSVQCDICKTEIKKMEYRNYLKSIKFDNLYYCRKNKCFVEKVKKSTFEKYGVSNTSKLEEKKIKWEKTNLEIYGHKNAFQSETIKEKIRQYYRDNYNGAEWNTQIKEVRDKNGWIPDEDLNGFRLYNRICRKYTARNKKELLEKWDGFDYYDGEYIKNNFKLYQKDPNYPTVDHKISVKQGYLIGLDEKIIADINNLCITKFGLNSSKRCKSEEEYKKNKF